MDHRVEHVSSKWVDSRHELLFIMIYRIPGSLSTNAAIFASVLLASRFDTNLDVFSLLSFAVEWFALFPIFRRYLQVGSLVNTHVCDIF